MGTRAVVNVFDHKDNKEHHVVSIYKQYDGYIQFGLGDILSDYLSNSVIYAGGMPWEIPSYWQDKHIHNGVDCFAAGLIGHLKNGQAGDVYIYNHGETPKLIEPGSLDCYIENTSIEYVYDIFVTGMYDDSSYEVQLDGYHVHTGDEYHNLAASIDTQLIPNTPPTFKDIDFVKDGTSLRGRVEIDDYVFSVVTIAEGHELDYTFRHYGSESEGTYEVMCWYKSTDKNVKLSEDNDVLGWQNENTINELFKKAFDGEEIHWPYSNEAYAKSFQY